MRTFDDRREAGQVLARHLAHLRDHDVVVLGLPRGGVPVAREVAAALHAPLDVIVVRKLGVLGQPELAMGAIGEGGVVVLNEDIIRAGDIPMTEVNEVSRREHVELDRRTRTLRAVRAREPISDREVVIVDDGIATGATARAACAVARAAGARRVVLAVPVAPPGWEVRFRDVADELVAVETPSPFRAVGEAYRDFSPTSDDDVVSCLRSSLATEGSMVLDVDGRRLEGEVAIPAAPTGLVVFAHGSGSSRHSPRNRHVAAMLQRAGLGTVLFDLLTDVEARDRERVFDVPLLAHRVLAATAALASDDRIGALPVGVFGASTGAAAALWAAAEPRSTIAAVVSRGGRPDLARPRLAAVHAPTLLIVGGRDTTVLALNREAAGELRCEHRLEVVPGASHLFEEPGTLDAAATLARDWFTAHLSIS